MSVEGKNLFTSEGKVPWSPSDPLYDPEGADPEGKHLQALVDQIDKGKYEPGDVCAVYEMCAHALCASSYNLWVEVQRAKAALRGEDVG